jgi:hypothetical protein
MFYQKLNGIYFITYIRDLRKHPLMKKYILPYAVAAMSLLALPAFSQSVADSTLLGLPGDNLDLYAVLDLFQKSKTIEEFEKSLNLEKTGINNMDLDLDKKVDFIKVVTKQDKDDFTFILQIMVSKTETQDVAVILVSKDDKGKITMQAVGNEDLYGKNHIVELNETSTAAVTANPAYKGSDTVKVVTAPAKTTTVIVEQAPVVQYVYSPAYVPYAPPYYYGYYPPYFFAFSVMAVGMYWGHHAHYHHGGYGYHGNTTIIHNENNFNNYNRTRNTSNTVNNNMKRGDYNRDNRTSTRPSASTRDASGRSNRQGGATAGTREASGRDRQAGGASANTRQSGGAGPTREAAGMSPSNRQSGVSTQPSRSSNGASRYSGGGGSSRGSSGYSGGGGASRGGGGFSGGGARGGGGRRR